MSAIAGGRWRVGAAATCCCRPVWRRILPLSFRRTLLVLPPFLSRSPFLIFSRLRFPKESPDIIGINIRSNPLLLVVFLLPDRYSLAN